MLYCIKDYVGLEYGHRTPATELVMVDDNQTLEIFTTSENWFITIQESRKIKINGLF
jgi:hypothetical protein